MEPIQSNRVEQTQPSLLEKIDAVDVNDTNKLSQALAGIATDINNEIQEVFSENGDNGDRVSKKEASKLNMLTSYLCNLNNRMHSAMTKANDDVKNVYQQLRQSLSDLIEKTTSAMNGKNPDAVALEPTEIDAQKNQYAHLDKKAETKLKPAIEYAKRLKGSAQAYAFNPYTVSDEIHIDSKVIQEIRELYMDMVSDGNGFGKRVFATPAKAKQLIAWAKNQLSWGNIDKTNYEDLTNEANEYLNSLNQQVHIDNSPDTSNQNQFWQSYQEVMTQEGHSHNGVDDLSVLGYSQEEAQQVLNSKKNIARK